MNQIGSTVQGQAVQSKDIVITGVLRDKTLETRRQLLRAVRPLVPARLVYNDTWEIIVYPTQTPTIEKSLTNANFQFSLKAPFPYWNNKEGSIKALSEIQGMFVFPWDLSKSFMFGDRVGNEFVNVINAGDVDTPFRIIFAASDDLESPGITNAITNEFLRIDKPMMSGETITVDITYRGISVKSDYMGVVTDIFGYLDIDSNLYRLHPGDNVLRYDAGENRDNLDAVIYFTTLRVGVYD
jgi:hypothetical protein